MHISINGESTEIEPESTIADLLDTLEMKSKYVAVERNRELVPRARHCASITGLGLVGLGDPCGAADDARRRPEVEVGSTFVGLAPTTSSISPRSGVSRMTAL